MPMIVQYVPVIEQLGALIDKEFTEDPGLRLTEVQIRRRWLLSEAESAAVLEYLTTAGSLVEDHHCQYTRPAVER
jgi:hypothetical protein